MNRTALSVVLTTVVTALTAAVVAAGSGGVAPAAVSPQTRPAEKKLPGPPWHLVDLWWDLGKESPFESYSIDVDISETVPSSVNLYVAPLGIAHLNKTPFYGGIQTKMAGYTKRNRRLHSIGRGFIFSMWGQRSLDAIRIPADGVCESSGYEGDFVSVRRPFDWKKGKYTYRVVRMDKEVVDGNSYTWGGVLVHSHETDENVFVGALRFPGENLTLGRKVASFVEIYGRRIPLTDIPKLTVTFGNLKVNGKPVDKPPVTAIYPKNAPDYASATCKDGAVLVTVGEEVKNRTQRQVKLNPGK